MAKAKKSAAPTLRITLRRSTIGRKPVHRRTVAALGLRRIGATVEHTATPQVLGMVSQVGYLLQVEEAQA